MIETATNLFGQQQPLTPPDTYTHVRFCIHGNGVNYTGTATLHTEDWKYIQKLWENEYDQDWVNCVAWEWDEGVDPPDELTEGTLRIGTTEEIYELQ